MHITGNEFEDETPDTIVDRLAGVFSGSQWGDDVGVIVEEIKDDLSGATIISAYYEYEDYSGSAFVLYEKDGKLYEVNGGHCSCYGLEGQWSPEETSVAALDMRNWDWESYGPEVKSVLSRLKGE